VAASSSSLSSSCRSKDTSDKQSLPPSLHVWRPSRISCSHIIMFTSAIFRVYGTSFGIERKSDYYMQSICPSVNRQYKEKNQTDQHSLLGRCFLTLARRAECWADTMRWSVLNFLARLMTEMRRMLKPGL